MKISTSTFGVIKTYGLEEGLEMLKKAGFEAIDYSITQNALNWDAEFLQDVRSAPFKEYFANIGRLVRDGGMEMYQCHAPYAPTTVSDLDFYARLQKKIIRSVYASAYMGCPNIVAHPVLHADFSNGQNRERAIQTTVDYFAAVAPALRETGVTMSVENLFFTTSGDMPRLPNACSAAEDLRDAVDTLNSKYGDHFAVCLDTGHARLINNDPAQMLKVFGSRLRTLHIQDNHGMKDEHLIPSKGIIDWKGFGLALGEIDYKGTFNFEVTTHFTDLPRDIYSKETFQHACSMLCNIGRSIADMAQCRKAE